MDFPRKPKFVHRANRDKTFDSICWDCFITVATEESEPDLEKAERNHVCDPSTIATYSKAARQS
jgi:hypothetical protein